MYCIIPSFKRINVRTIKVAVMLCLCMPFSVMVGGGVVVKLCLHAIFY